MDFIDQTPFCNRMTRYAGRGLAYHHEAFQRLQQVSTERPASTSFKESLALLGAPLVIIHSLSSGPELASAWAGRNNSYQANTVKSALSNLRIVHLQYRDDSSFTSNDLAYVVQSRRGVRSLNLDWPLDTTTGLAWNWCWRPSLDAILSRAADTLEHLSLEYGVVRYLTEIRAAVERPQMQILLPSLRTFSRLKTLKLGMAFIFGLGTITYRNFGDPVPSYTDYLPYSHQLSSILPPSIETLYLVGHEFEMLAPLLLNAEKVLDIAQTGQKFLSLKSIIIENHCDPEQLEKEGRADHKLLFVARMNLGRYEDIEDVLGLQMRGSKIGVNIQWISQLCPINM